MPQRPHAELRQSPERIAKLACRERDRDPLCQQAAGNKREHQLRLAIEPLRIIDRTEQRPLLRRLRQKPEHRQSDQERVRSRPSAESERDGKGFTLGLREAFHELEHRRAQLLKRRVRELHLPIDPRGLEDPELLRGLARIPENGGLADAWLSLHDQYPAAPAARRVDQPVDRVELPLPAK